MLQTFYLSIIHQNHKYPLSQYGRAFFSSPNCYISTEAGTEVCISWEYLTEMWFASVDLLWQAVGYKIDWLEGHHGPSGAITKVKSLRIPPVIRLWDGLNLGALRWVVTILTQLCFIWVDFKSCALYISVISLHSPTWHQIIIAVHEDRTIVHVTPANKHYRGHNANMMGWY